MSSSDSESGLPREFRKYFWDVAFDELTIEKHSRFIAERLLNYGDLNSIRWLFSWADQDFIRALVNTSRNLNAKSRNFWELMFTQSPD